MTRAAFGVEDFGHEGHEIVEEARAPDLRAPFEQRDRILAVIERMAYDPDERYRTYARLVLAKARREVSAHAALTGREASRGASSRRAV